MSGRPTHIIISPVDDLDPELHLRVSSEVQRIFHYPTEIVPLLNGISFAYDQDRDQYHSTVILERLSLDAPAHGLRVLAITGKDLYIPILTYVFGEAQLNGKACVVSTYRLKENLLFPVTREKYYGRTTKEAIHELGHTFNLRHCRDPDCIMHYCRSIHDVDSKSQELCRYCRILLADEQNRLEEGSSGMKKEPLEPLPS